MDGAERDRWNHLPREDDRIRFVATRYFLRQTLSKYVGEEPEDLILEIEALGKPYLPQHPWLNFNLSHTGNTAVVALTKGCRIGVDVESLDRTMTQMPRILKRKFTPLERLSLSSIPGQQQRRSFLEAWTRKEAFIKATGEGLTRNLQSFEVSMNSDGHERGLISIGGSMIDARAWTVLSFAMHGHVVGSVAVQRPKVSEVNCFEWQGCQRAT